MSEAGAPQPPRKRMRFGRYFRLVIAAVAASMLWGIFLNEYASLLAGALTVAGLLLFHRAWRKWRPKN